jgi:hypothetical protein
MRITNQILSLLVTILAAFAAGTVYAATPGSPFAERWINGAAPDHIAGDAEFRGRTNITVVGTTPAEVAGFFGIRKALHRLGDIPAHERHEDFIIYPRL